MPIFDYKCSQCGHEYKDVFVHHWDSFQWCVKCGSQMTKLYCVPNMHLFPIGGVHLKNVCPGGKTFHSKNEMKKYARKHDLELGALL